MCHSGYFFDVSADTRLYYEDHGAGKPLVLLHGYLCSSRYFAGCVEALAAGNRLILVDWGGHGASRDASPALSMEHCAATLQALFEHLDLREVALLGWSMGGSVALAYYKQFGPQRLRAIGMIDSALFPLSPAAWNCHALAGSGEAGLEKALRERTARYEAFLPAFARSLFKHPPDARTIAWAVAEARHIPLEAANALYADFARFDGVSVLDAVTIPSLVFCAESPLFPEGTAMARSYADRLGSACFFHAFTEEGHAMFLENPDLFCRKLGEFLEGVRE